MKKKTVYFLLFFLCILNLNAQEYIYKTDLATLKFKAAKTSIEPISAINSKSKIILNSTNGEIACLLKIVDFSFANKLMEEHFNENYLESDIYPKASFLGKIENFNNLDFTKEQTTKITGVFKIHGKSKEKTFYTSILKKDKNYILNSNFKLGLKDFGIKIPRIMFYKIAEEVDIVLTSELKK